MTASLLFGVHAHQPAGNFPEVFEWFETAGLRDIRAIEPEVTLVGTRPEAG